MDLRDVDLNLLVALDALLRHRSVSLAARELDLSQPAMSAALGRLRVLLSDPLLVRTGRGMMPTVRAEQLARPVADILEKVRETVLSGGDFEPSQARRRFTLCLSDVGSYVLWPRIVRALRIEAPQVALRMRTVEQAGIGAALESGDIDLAVGAYPELPRTLYQQRLFERSYVLLMRKGHRLAREPLDPARFAAAEHAVVRASSGVQDMIDRELARLRLTRRSTLELPSYLMLPPLIDGGETVAVIPGQLAEAFMPLGRFAAVALPLPLPAITIRQHWHRRFHADSGNAWLRATLASLFGERPSARWEHSAEPIVPA